MSITYNALVISYLIKIDKITSKNGSTENRTRVICFIGVYLYHESTERLVADD